MYFETNQMCQKDPSCAHPFECKIGQSFQLKCNEYLICSSNGIVEHRFCPPFYRWDNEAQQCIPDNACLSSSNKACKEGEVIDSFDCKFYYQCSGGKWHKISCMTYPTELCKGCRYNSDHASQTVEEKCSEGDTVANPQDCRNYAICIGKKWKNRQCKVGNFWNQQLKRCHHTTDCKVFKRAKCNHGQHLIGGGICNEYLKCLQGSWITMKCLPGYAFDVMTKKCVISDQCVSSNNNYLSIIDYGITTAPLSSLFQSEMKMERNQQLHWPCQFGSKIRNEYDCNRYFECAIDGYKDRYCKDNYEFNDESGQCQKEYHCDLSRCRNGRTIESEICGHYQICINGTWHKRVCEDNRQFVDGYCRVTTYCNDDNKAISSILLQSSSSCKEGNIMADDIDHKRYFICRNGRFQEQFCWNCASFDRKHGYCVRDTVCVLEESCIGDNVKADKQDRTAYRICNNGKSELHSCPNGLVYTHSSRRCEKDSVVDNAKHETCKDSGGPTGYRADPNDCHKFYQCAHGKWVSKTCPAKLYWNVEKTTCDWLPDNELCKNYITRILL
ncbi:unnamed protein product [Cercopithifilaria johnstoni]|uniref:Chitin-binding type-2 domain-containing protein n=1 Tax=Cercopithifilaria johnstoni TaxID=2874296 RepID=A0A8J2M4Z8_9BILA|nr:unnamed protein product [Cercopithifilaria johnstoni]